MQNADRLCAEYQRLSSRLISSYDELCAILDDYIDGFDIPSLLEFSERRAEAASARYRAFMLKLELAAFRLEDDMAGFSRLIIDADAAMLSELSAELGRIFDAYTSFCACLSEYPSRMGAHLGADELSLQSLLSLSRALKGSLDAFGSLLKRGE